MRVASMSGRHQNSRRRDYEKRESLKTIFTLFPRENKATHTQANKNNAFKRAQIIKVFSLTPTYKTDYLGPTILSD